MLLKVTRRSFLLGSGAILAARRATPLPPELAGADLSFIQVSDTHVSKRRLYDPRRGFDVPAEESIRRTREVVKAINECTLPYELVIHTGDVAHTRDTNEDFDLAQELHQFKRTVYYLPGDHDLGYSNTHAFRPEFEKRFGKTNVAIEPVDGLRFALFDSQPLDTRASEKDHEWAFAQLDRLLAPAKPTILFCHVMGLESFHVNRLWEGWPESHMRRWTDRMKKGGVLAVLAGHFHREELHFVNGLPFYLCGPVVNMWGRQTCFRHWGIRDGEMSYRTVYLEI